MEDKQYDDARHAQKADQQRCKRCDRQRQAKEATYQIYEKQCYAAYYTVIYEPPYYFYGYHQKRPYYIDNCQRDGKGQYRT